MRRLGLASGADPGDMRRKNVTRGRSLPLRVSAADLARGRAEQPPEINAACPRPATYGECLRDGLGTEYPCPYVSCAMNLYLDVKEGHGAGNIKLNFPDVEPHEMVRSCALAEAARGGMSRRQVADRLNLVRMSVENMEIRVLSELKLSRMLAAL